MAFDPNAPDPYANLVPPSTVATPIATPLPMNNGFQQPLVPPTTINPNPFAYSNTISAAEGPSWKLRKRIVLYTLIFCALLISYVTYKGADTRLNETIIQSCFFLAGSVIGSFIFGAVWHDSNMNK